MSQKRHLCCAVAVIVAIWSSPWILAHLYTEKGAHILHHSLSLDGRRLEDDPWLGSASLKSVDARAEAREGISLFQQGIDIKRDYAQAYRWLGRAALLLDAPDQAQAAFAQYLQLKPENPLGYWELGLAYERLARRVAEATYWRLDFGLEDASTILSSVTEPLTTSLESAYLETPDVAIETPYCEDEWAPASCFAGRDLWTMPLTLPDPILFLTESVQSEVLFMHPPSQATWEITLPVTPTAVSFWMGLDPQAKGWWGDGVTFRVLVDDTEIFVYHLTAEQAQAGWQPASVDLSVWSGQRVHLALATDPGPLGDGAGDWAGWGNVRVVADESEGLSWVWLRAAWERAGITAQDLIAAGERARRAERYEEALE
jgi:tetratricopeptide (TPR) repeat protein